jgi:hypothetical protein
MVPVVFVETPAHAPLPPITAMAAANSACLVFEFLFCIFPVFMSSSKTLFV